jgi:hypothetical protein
MSGTAEQPTPYAVSYSGRVRQRLLELADAARARGDGEAFLASLREFDRRLRVYPQFGDPLSDLSAEVGQVRLGVVPPLAMRYGVLEERRMVFVAALPVLMPRRSGE